MHKHLHTHRRGALASRWQVPLLQKACLYTYIIFFGAAVTCFPVCLPLPGCRKVYFDEDSCPAGKQANSGGAALLLLKAQVLKELCASLSLLSLTVTVCAVTLKLITLTWAALP